MCGIFGITDASRVPQASKHRALSLISHRGPDHMGQFSDDFVFLGHTRLAILDLSELAHQPMSSGPWTIVFNGEIYNHLEIRRRFLSDFSFKTHSDTETLLEAFARMGVSILPHLEGMFAFAVYNSSTTQLWIVRDSLGIKPVYYSQVQATGQLIFSSEIKSILPFMSSVTADANSLACYLAFENFPNPASLFSQIQLLSPGEILIWNPDGFRSERFVARSGVSYDGADIVETGRAVIDKSVKNHLLSDVPVGVFLSGGIDSSLVATLATRHTNNLIGFTGYFSTKGTHYDERPYTRILAKHIGVPLEEVEITPDDFLNIFDKLIWHLDEPRMGMGSFSQYAVAAVAAKKRRVLLAGHGGDELFGGYPMHKASWYVQKGRWAVISAVLRGEFSAKEGPWLLYALGNALLHKRILFAPQINGFDCNLGARFSTSDIPAALGQLFRYYKDVYLNGLLVVEDKVSMAHSLESRVPLWAQPVLDFAESIPPEIKLQGGVLKAVLKQIAKPLLPPEILTAPKRGFPTPLRRWFRNELYSFVLERLAEPNPVVEGFFPRSRRIQLAKMHHSLPLPFALDERRAHRIWMLLCLESWSRQHQVSAVQ